MCEYEKIMTKPKHGFEYFISGNYLRFYPQNYATGVKKNNDPRRIMNYFEKFK